MKLLITGATGLVGAEIVKLALAKNHTIHFLTTSKSKIVNKENYKGFYWNPAKAEIDTNCLNGIEAILNLAGASISKRWTKDYKNEILESRINSVQLLHKTLSENTHQVKHFCSASALGIYPSSFTKKYDETVTDVNPTFLGKVVHKWEQEVDKLSSLDIQVSKLRIGIVLSKNGGALTQMLKPIKLGFGAAIASGKQFQSWIHIKDLARLFLFVVEQNLSGSYNAVATNPVTNLEMTKAIATRLKKPLWLPNIPTFMMKLLLGEMSDLVLESQYLKNDKIKNEGFEFEFETVEETLANVITRNVNSSAVENK